MTLFRSMCGKASMPLPGKHGTILRPNQLLSHSRPFCHTSRYNHPRKDSQDKDSINTEATEYSKSATDDESARQEDAAFDPSVTDPQEQKDLAGKGHKVETQSHHGPLRVSGASILRKSLAQSIIGHIDSDNLVIWGIGICADCWPCTGREQPSRS